MQNVTHWFLVGYILGCRWWYMRVVRVVSLVGCKDYLSSHELSSLTYITPNESWNALCSLYAGGVLWVRGPSPFPSPQREGRNHRDTPMANHQHLTTITQHPSLAVMLCELCMPEAFCVLDTVRKKALLTLWALWEKELPSESHASHLLERVFSISHRKTQMNRTHRVSQRH